MRRESSTGKSQLTIPKEYEMQKMDARVNHKFRQAPLRNKSEIQVSYRMFKENEDTESISGICFTEDANSPSLL